MARKITYKAGLPGAEKEITVEVHDLDADPWPLGAPLEHVGTDVPRLDGMAKATGTARYTQDVLPTEKAHAGVVGCPHAHAKVVRVDLEAAQALKGVLATRSYGGSTLTYPGAAAAAVCAVSQQVLEDALALVRVTYEVLPHVVTVEDALEDKVIVSGRSNDSLKASGGGRPGRRQRGQMRRGDPESALKEADVVVEAEYRTQIQTHSALEPHGSVARLDADGKATVWASTQGTSGFANGTLAQRLGVKRGDIRVITEHMGGGFGAKFGAGPWDLLCAEFAKEIKRPVSYLLTRRLEHLVGGNRPDSIQKMKLGGTKDGRFEVIAGETWGTSGNSKGGANCANSSAYRWPNVLMKQHGVSTHTARGRAFRAPGHPQGFFALESLIDRYAAKIGKDPLEVRLDNDPHVVRQIQWKLGAERIDWAKRRAAKPSAGPIRKGVGCAGGRWGSGGRGRWIVELDISSDGHVQVRNGAQDIGTGTRTLLAILAAEELGIDPAQVDVRMGDTNFPPGPGSGGSTTAPSLGPAAREAGLRGREGLESLLRKEWGLSDEAALTWKDGVCKGPGGKSATFREACGLIGDEKLSVRGQRRPNFAAFERTTAGCQFAAVSVDIETGVVKVDHVVAVHDCGRIINNLTARSQVNGGVIQGIGYALFEERQLDKNLGDMVNATLDTYRIPGMQDCPPIDVILTPVVSGINSVGMMGLGEPATVPTAGAIANAVFHAIGVQVLELPMTPARVLAALEGKAS